MEGVRASQRRRTPEEPSRRGDQVPELEAEDVGRERQRRIAERAHGVVCGELKSFGRKRIDMDGLLFILFKLSAVIFN
jgi:hypothetical protein